MSGANAATMESTVTQVIEQQLTGIDNLLYFSAISNGNGTATITLSFATGTNPDIAELADAVGLRADALKSARERNPTTTSSSAPTATTSISSRTGPMTSRCAGA